MAISNTNAQRSITSLLPPVNQTDALKGFFSATADHLFQPGLSETISGYVGRQPSYYNPSTDFYLAEPTAARTAYQLEPCMVSYSNANVLTDNLFYDDLINYLNSQGAVTSNPSRLFEGDYYSWAPPVDLDKLNNYQQYFWMGSLDDADRQRTTLTLWSPAAVHYGDGATTTFNLPAADVRYGSSEEPMVFVAGVATNCAFVDGQAVLASAPAAGVQVLIYRYGDLTKVINGRTTFDFDIFQAWQAFYSYNVGDVVQSSGTTYICTVAHVSIAAFDDAKWNAVNGASTATTGMRLRLVDGLGTTVAAARYFWLDGVGSSILLSPDHTADAGGTAGLYTVIDRRSTDGNAWSKRNMWAHKAAFTWSGLTLATRQAQRPIIEFIPNLQIYNYGWNRLPDVQGVLTTPYAKGVDNFGVFPYGDNTFDDTSIEVSTITGRYVGTDPDTGEAIGSVEVDRNYVLQPNDRFLVAQSTTDQPQLNSNIYRITVVPDQTLADGAVVSVFELVLENQPVLGDIVRVAQATDSVFSDSLEYWFDGTQWQLAQSSSSIPLFALFDFNGVALDDAGSYSQSNFAGNSLFQFQTASSGTTDPYLGIVPVYDSYGDLTFSVTQASASYTYEGGPIIGFFYSLVRGADSLTYVNNWYAEPQPSSQTATNGVYSIPLNLQANPNNETVETISRNQWFDHFSSIMTAQTGFTGQPYTTNNWRDTAKDLSLGTEILQHRSPLLKVMLMCGNVKYDMPAALRYAEHEYVRFRNRFIQTVINLRDLGTLLDSDAPETWVSTVLNQLRVAKTSAFPFALSTMAGGSYFIPPTPTFLGLSQAVVPGFVTDDTFPSSITMLLGHDGSLTPTYGDIRDNIMLALEQQIYASVNSKFKTDERPVFDLQPYMAGQWRAAGSTGYTLAEISGIVGSTFQLWAQSNKLDFRANNGYDPTDPFTWNYSAVADRYGQSVPGNWRGIYRYYFDTDRPHSNPWEMLGFAAKPSWWDSTYGPAPYTSGNAKLWDDLRDGRIQGGPREGIDPTYARPGLYDVLPVDESGVLLNPMQCGIIPFAPTLQQGSAEWAIGDEGPVEHLWRTSTSYPFARALLGFLTKTARFTEQGWDTINNIQDSTGQWIYAPTGNRPADSSYYVHGEVNASGNKVTVIGVQQWISDYMVSKGQNPADFGSAVRGLTVQLGHKMAGYTTVDDMSVMADNFGLVPAQNVTLNLYTSPSVAQYVYSGVLIEKYGTGYRVVGYDTVTPSFTIMPGLTTGPKGTISLSSTPEPVVVAWRPNTFYPLNTLVIYKNSYYRCSTSHTSAATFQGQNWTLDGSVQQQAPRVTTYLLGDGTTQAVPYGTVFTSFQEVADFLLGYERYLKSCGWVFDTVDTDTQTTRDFSQAVFDFLSWAQVGWATGNFIALSPAAYGAVFQTALGQVMNLLTPINGVYGLLGRTGQPINRRDVFVSRENDTTTIQSANNDLYCARINISATEHALLFSNETIFNNLIYDPLYNLRQPRLKLIGRRTTNWTGRLDAPGFVVLGNSIASNFDKTSQDIRFMFDIEKADNTTLRDQARSVIGYDSRSYLENLVLSETEQFEFYQGLIHQKGASGAFDKLLRSDFIESNTAIQFFEEWAFKICDYGATNTTQRVAFTYTQSDVQRDPQFVHFRANSVVEDHSGFDDVRRWTVDVIGGAGASLTEVSSFIFGDGDPSQPATNLTFPFVSLAWNNTFNEAPATILPEGLTATFAGAAPTSPITFSFTLSGDTVPFASVSFSAGQTSGTVAFPSPEVIIQLGQTVSITYSGTLTGYGFSAICNLYQ